MKLKFMHRGVCEMPAFVYEITPKGARVLFGSDPSSIMVCGSCGDLYVPDVRDIAPSEDKK